MNEKSDDDPAYTMGRAADMLGTTQAFLPTVVAGRNQTSRQGKGHYLRLRFSSISMKDSWTANLILAEHASEPTIIGIVDNDRTWWGDPEADWPILVEVGRRDPRPVRP
ncbi:hypothetical protein ACWDXV_23485 [Nocardia nova]